MFVKGKSGNPNGRPPGSPNKVSEKIREKLNQFLADNFDAIQNDLMLLEARERVKFYIDLLSFGLPKPKTAPPIEEPETIKVILPDFCYTDEELLIMNEKKQKDE